MIQRWYQQAPIKPKQKNGYPWCSCQVFLGKTLTSGCKIHGPREERVRRAKQILKLTKALESNKQSKRDS